jgi:hypothetical protein
MPGLPPALAEDLVEHQRGDATVHQSRRPLVGRAEVEVRRSSSVRVARDGQRRGHSVAQADDGVAPGAAAAAGVEADAERPVQLPLAQALGDRLDLHAGLEKLVLVDLGPDHGVHELAHALGERAVHRALTVELLERQVFLHVAGHAGNPRRRSTGGFATTETDRWLRKARSACLETTSISIGPPGRRRGPISP